MLNRINPKIIQEFYQRKGTVKKPTAPGGSGEAKKDTKGKEGKLIDDE
jgi:hypothetical protein